MSKMTQKKVPNPGSPEAQALGCKCPVMDNHSGRGCGWISPKGEPLFWFAEGCPVHKKPQATPKSKAKRESALTKRRGDMTNTLDNKERE